MTGPGLGLLAGPAFEETDRGGPLVDRTRRVTRSPRGALCVTIALGADNREHAYRARVHVGC